MFFSKIRFENRKKGDNGSDCMLSVDGTDYPMPWWGNLFKSHKYKGQIGALRYEVGIGIKSGDICWWNGPYEPGMWNDHMIFGDGLVHELEDGERVEADDGYLPYAPNFAVCPGCGRVI